MESDTKKIESDTPESKVYPEGRMTFTEHLGELRVRLVRSAIAVFVGCVVCYFFAEEIITIVAGPLSSLQAPRVADAPEPVEGLTDGEGGGAGGAAERGAEGAAERGAGGAAERGAGGAAEGAPETFQKGVTWTILNPLEPVLVSLKLAAYGGILLALPYLVFNICAFIFPGLTAVERRVVKILLFGCSILAMSGLAVAYFGVFPLVLPYLLEWTPDFVVTQLRLNETISLLLKGMMGFALAFQFPMVVLILVYMDLLSPETLKKYRRVAVVGMFVLGALLTPPDPFSMAMMATPLVLLYEVSIWMSYLVVRRKRATAQASEAGGAAGSGDPA